MYSKKVMDCFEHPKNMGEIENPDGIGEVGNLQCGDIMKITIRVSKNKKGREIIKDIKFRTMGCVAAIASSSITTEIVKGKTLDEALKITRKIISNKLGGLPPIKEHCSVLAADALKKAIEDYRKKSS